MSVRRLEFITKFDWFFRLVGAMIFASIFFCVGSYVGYLKGYENGSFELKYLMTLPDGGLYMSSETASVWSAMNGNALSWVKIPPPEVARIIKTFEVPKQVTNSTTTTTIVEGNKK